MGIGLIAYGSVPNNLGPGRILRRSKQFHSAGHGHPSRNARYQFLVTLHGCLVSQGTHDLRAHSYEIHQGASATGLHLFRRHILQMHHLWQGIEKQLHRLSLLWNPHAMTFFKLHPSIGLNYSKRLL